MAEPIAAEYVWSDNPERYLGDQYPTRAEALAAGRNEIGQGATIWTAEAGASPRASDFVPDMVRALIEGTDGSDYGDCAEGEWPSVSAEQSDDLHRRVEEAVDAWATEHGLQPTFFLVNDPEEHAPLPEAPDEVAGVVETKP